MQKLLSLLPYILNKKVWIGIAVIVAVLVSLKLSAAIDWSWWLVLLPFWLPLALIIIPLIITIIKIRKMKNQFNDMMNGGK